MSDTQSKKVSKSKSIQEPTEWTRKWFKQYVIEHLEQAKFVDWQGFSHSDNTGSKKIDIYDWLLLVEVHGFIKSRKKVKDFVVVRFELNNYSAKSYRGVGAVFYVYTPDDKKSSEIARLWTAGHEVKGEKFVTTPNRPIKDLQNDEW